MHRKAQIGERGLGRFVGVARFEPLRGAMETFAHGPMFVGIAEFAQQPADLVRAPPRFLDQPQRGGERDPASLRVFENAALEDAALPWPVPINLARAVLTQGRARLGKAGDRRLAARNRNRQSECLQFRLIVAGLELDEIEERPVTAQPAREA